ncbi:16S rRNA (guanine(966)-N(2))-methyltransferase RsmD [Geobacter sp. DSM 9736]|uniref:16S rRNA (guanine(966)-N(2))-methyltransferase RsmD n=1 Tax=Geobacter sp. DSM 9736 TaxID=1277350 RepID=UPI000B500170|nr:16S rRNA (guanine(966)-N(2))-methyltransferase RsmD [Geobacter sp. DSM 9736]SNB45770.1 16S rRNA (guanine(966)-N(2))-methyltransferase RsmD [Geobacter sp. DSM 9736]
MRIVAGSAKGRKLLVPKGQRVRPTADRVKEAVFSILKTLLGDLDGCRVLDIFAGTGNLGIEALSRGAASAVFIDNHRESALTIEKNIRLAGFSEKCRIIQSDALRALQAIEKERIRFRLVFLDPPYRIGFAEKVLNHLGTSTVIEPGAVIVTEHSLQENLQDRFGNLQKFDARTYGDTALSFFSPEEREEFPVADET